MQALRHAFEGLQYMHNNNRLHQSLGPGSLLLSTAQERDAALLRGQLVDLAFSVDVSAAALGGEVPLEAQFRARAAGAAAPGSDRPCAALSLLLLRSPPSAAAALPSFCCCCAVPCVCTVVSVHASGHACEQMRAAMPVNRCDRPCL